MKTAIALLLLMFMVSGCGTMYAVTHTNAFHAPTVQDNPPAGTIGPGETLQNAVQREVHWMWFISILLAIACGLCVYMQNYFMAIKFGLAALALPVVATLWSLYWAWVIAGIFVAIAVVAYLHYRVVIDPWFKSKTTARIATSSSPAPSTSTSSASPPV
jgi:hypothetical protein